MKLVKDKYHMISLICGIQKKKDTNGHICTTETDSETMKTNLQLPKGTVGGGEGWIGGLGLAYGISGQQETAKQHRELYSTVFDGLYGNESEKKKKNIDFM